jgi:hypothetical protein
VPTPAEELLAEYEAREREGLDFMRIRPGSVIADAPVVKRCESALEEVFKAAQLGPRPRSR